MLISPTSVKLRNAAVTETAAVTVDDLEITQGRQFRTEFLQYPPTELKLHIEAPTYSSAAAISYGDAHARHGTRQPPVDTCLPCRRGESTVSQPAA